MIKLTNFGFSAFLFTSLLMSAGHSSAATILTSSNNGNEFAYDSNITTANLLYSRPISTTAGPDLGFALTGINNGAAQHGTGPDDTYFGAGDLGATSLLSNPAVTITLDTVANPTGYSLTSIQTINGWQNYDQSFSDQAYTVYYSTVANPLDFSLTLATIDYHPFLNGSGGSPTNNDPSSSMVTISGITGVDGVAALRFVLTPSLDSGGLNPQGGSVIREFQAFGTPTAVPEPSSWALMLGGLVLLGFCLRRKAALLS